MAKQNKKSVALNIKIDQKASDKLVEISCDTGLTKTAIVENAIAMFFDYYKETGRIKKWVKH